MPNNPFSPEEVDARHNSEVELNTARLGLQAIDELKKTKHGYPYLVERLEDRAKEFLQKALSGPTAEEREVGRLIYKCFQDEIIPMLDRDEEMHRRTVSGG